MERARVSGTLTVENSEAFEILGVIEKQGDYIEGL